MKGAHQIPTRPESSPIVHHLMQRRNFEGDPSGAFCLLPGGPGRELLVGPTAMLSVCRQRSNRENRVFISFIFLFQWRNDHRFESTGKCPFDPPFSRGLDRVFRDSVGKNAVSSNSCFQQIAVRGARSSAVSSRPLSALRVTPFTAMDEVPTSEEKWFQSEGPCPVDRRRRFQDTSAADDRR